MVSGRRLENLREPGQHPETGTGYAPTMIGRRRFLEVLAALGVSQALPTCATDRKVSFDSYPVTLGVASGYPSPSGVALCTPLMGLEPHQIPVRSDLTADDAMRQVTSTAEPPDCPP